AEDDQYDRMRLERPADRLGAAELGSYRCRVLVESGGSGLVGLLPALCVWPAAARLGQHHDASDALPQPDDVMTKEAAEHAHEDLDQADLRVAQEEAVHPETAEEDPEQADDEAALGLALRSGASGGLSVGALAVRGGASGGRAIGVRRRGAGACCG